MRFHSLALILILASGSALAQRKAVRSGTQPVRPTSPIAKPEAPPYNLKLRIGEGPKLFLSIVSFADTDEIFPSFLSSLVDDLSTGAGSSNPPQKPFPKVVIEASPNITMLDFWNPVKLFPLGGTEVSLFLPGVDVLDIKAVPKDDQYDIKPNPLRLVVTIDDGDKLSLNNLPAGSLTITQLLVDRLRGLFNERETNAVFREGTNSVETAVTIVMPMSQRKFSDLVTIAGAVKKAGSRWISVMMDNDQVDTRKELPDALPPGLFDTPPVVPRKKKPRH